MGDKGRRRGRRGRRGRRKEGLLPGEDGPLATEPEADNRSSKID